MNKWRIKKGDTVQVIAGQDKGVKGELLRVLRDERRVVVKGVHVCKKHQKPSRKCIQTRNNAKRTPLPHQGHHSHKHLLTGSPLL